MTLPNCYPTSDCPTRLIDADTSDNQQRYVKLTSEPTSHPQRTLTEAQKNLRNIRRRERSAAVRQPSRSTFLTGEETW